MKKAGEPVSKIGRVEKTMKQYGERAAAGGLRRKLFDLVDGSAGVNDADPYDYAMIVVIVLSLVPLGFKQSTPFLYWLDKVTAVLFVADYLLRWFTADILLRRGPWSFLLYPFTFMALIDLLCILPSFTVIADGVRVLKLIRLLRALRVFRAAKLLRYSRSLLLIVDVIRGQRKPLLAVLVLAVGYIIVSAMIVFNIEPETFGTFFDAVYWAAMSLTTVGYGDIYPVTMAGKGITMLSSFFGIAIVALPAGIMTAGYMDQVKKERAEAGADADETQEDD